MNTRTPISHPWFSQRRLALCLASLLLVITLGCAPASTQPPVQPTESAVEPTAAPSAIEPTPTTPSPTATSEASIPAGWTTFTSHRCEYDLSYPADMEVSLNGSYSHTLSFNLANPEVGARNFVYVSVIDPEIQGAVERGVYDFEVYNYDPRGAAILLTMRVGESKPVNPAADVAPWFTFERKPDTTISGYPAQTYENVQPWEFPEGTKEMRYYLSLDSCTYQIGGYLDTTQSNQPGAITEDLFNQIVATMRVMP